MFPCYEYDSAVSASPKNQILDSDCLWDCLYYIGCDYSLLGNGVCDQSCNPPYCGFDLGDCGYCWNGCKLYLGYEYMLGGTCDEVCNVIDYYIDMGACKGCSTNCTSDMLGNGICDPEYNGPFCNYDFGDCENSSCAPGCYTYMIGDSTCQEECHVEECNYDEYDCDCYPECKVFSIGNSFKFFLMLLINALIN
ncbi:unnamed protein product [Blepharisma stoltei]|uniref:LNR domain-containing protein n=1 Tax=Blepharisma stoltei TaxID=1481888 RepID=A0AAU9ICK1_9CILI|nr:unnamed protein product [Blepharisma stoltei]